MTFLKNTTELIDSGKEISIYDRISLFSNLIDYVTFSHARKLPVRGFQYGINANNSAYYSGVCKTHGIWFDVELLEKQLAIWIDAPTYLQRITYGILMKGIPCTVKCLVSGETSERTRKY
jgi:hypothetical protein